MTSSVKISRSIRAGAIAAAVFLSLLSPSRPLAENKARRLHETSVIYRMLQASASEIANFGTTDTWGLAQTIWRESNKQSLDPMLVLAVIRVESEFRPTAVSPDGARGLMQVLPGVADALAEEAELESWEGARSLDDPTINVKFGTWYLGSLKEKFGDLRIALTAYNRGPTWVEQQLETKVALPLEYPKKVLAVFRHYRERGAKG